MNGQVHFARTKSRIGRYRAQANKSRTSRAPRKTTKKRPTKGHRAARFRLEPSSPNRRTKSTVTSRNARLMKTDLHHQLEIEPISRKAHTTFKTQLKNLVSQGDIPYNQSFTRTTNQPSFRPGSDKHGPYMEIVGSEIVQQLTVTVDPPGQTEIGDTMAIIYMSPLMFRNTILKKVSSNYTRFKIQDIALEYIKSASADTPGMIGISPIMDVEASLGHGIEGFAKFVQAQSAQNSVQTSVYTNAICKNPHMEDHEPFYIYPEDSDRWELPGYFLVLSGSVHPQIRNETSRQIGILQVHYNIRLYQSLLLFPTDTVFDGLQSWQSVVFDELFDASSIGLNQLVLGINQSYWPISNPTEIGILYIVQNVTDTAGNILRCCDLSNMEVDFAAGQVLYVRLLPTNDTQRYMLFTSISTTNIEDALTWRATPSSVGTVQSGLIRFEVHQF